MPTVTHPRALDDVAGHSPARVTVHGATYPVSDGQVTLPDERDVSALAAAYGVPTDALRTTETCDAVKADGDVCGRELPCSYHSDD